MQIGDLLHGDFSFNVKFRVYRYHSDEDRREFVGDDKFGLPLEVLDKWISAINQADDGTVEIEFVELC